MRLDLVFEDMGEQSLKNIASSVHVYHVSLEKAGTLDKESTKEGRPSIAVLPEKKSIDQIPTENIEAYTYYLRGREFMRRSSKHNLQIARRMFARATELDPSMHALTLAWPIAIHICASSIRSTGQLMESFPRSQRLCH